MTRPRKSNKKRHELTASARTWIAGILILLAPVASAQGLIDIECLSLFDSRQSSGALLTLDRAPLATIETRIATQNITLIRKIRKSVSTSYYAETESGTPVLVKTADGENGPRYERGGYLVGSLIDSSLFAPVVERTLEIEVQMVQVSVHAWVDQARPWISAWKYGLLSLTGSDPYVRTLNKSADKRLKQQFFGIVLADYLLGQFDRLGGNKPDNLLSDSQGGLIAIDNSRLSFDQLLPFRLPGFTRELSEEFHQWLRDENILDRFTRDSLESLGDAFNRQEIEMIRRRLEMVRASQSEATDSHDR